MRLTGLLLFVALFWVCSFAQPGVLVTTEGKTYGLKEVLNTGHREYAWTGPNAPEQVNRSPLAETFILWEYEKWPRLITPPASEYLSAYPGLKDKLIFYERYSKKGSYIYRQPEIWRYKDEIYTIPWRSKNARAQIILGWILIIGGLGVFGWSMLLGSITASESNWVLYDPSASKKFYTIGLVALLISGLGIAVNVTGISSRRQGQIGAYNAYQLYESGYIQDHDMIPLIGIHVPLNRP